MITKDQFDDLAREYRVIPVVSTIFSGSESPLSIFEKLAADKAGSFLLESAEQGVWSRYSFVGIDNHGYLYSTASGLRWVSSTGANPFPRDSADVSALPTFEALEAIQKSWNAAPVSDLPPLVAGLVGLMGWDSVHQIESLGPSKPKDFPVPDLAMAVIRDLVVVDHQQSSLHLVSNVYISDDADLDHEYESAVRRIDAMKNGLLRQSQPFLAEVEFSSDLEFSRRTTDKDFLEMVKQAKQHVIAGDAFQVVLSQRFEMPLQAEALDVYRMLRALNPSPYMYLLNFFDENGPFSVVGSSPEALVRVQNGKATLHPIAGSRPRGATVEEDSALAQDLLEDAKERAEHLMLVDLARNDLLRVCYPDSVSVTEFMAVERYSHIMHLVSTVEGTLLPYSSAVGVVKAAFPAGTLSGAPKPRALEIIESIEPTNRGLFGGVVGYFDFLGNADLAIAIRTAVLRNGTAYVQAGAGIVLDSDPSRENEETLNKASAPLRAVQAANRMKRLSE